MTEQCRVTREKNATFFRIRAGDVQLVSGEAFGIFERVQHFEVVFDCVAEDIRNYWHRILPQLGKFVAYKCGHADILQAHGVDHSGVCVPEPRRWITGYRLAREPLGNDSAELIQVKDA